MWLFLRAFGSFWNCPELVHAGVLRPGQYVRLAEFNIVEGALCVQLHTETALFVQFAILLVEVESTRRDFINTLKRELKPALQKLQASNIAPVDLAQSAIGPGMGVYSRYSNVLEADGTPDSFTRFSHTIFKIYGRFIFTTTKIWVCCKLF